MGEQTGGDTPHLCTPGLRAESGARGLVAKLRSVLAAELMLLFHLVARTYWLSYLLYHRPRGCASAVGSLRGCRGWPRRCAPL